MHACIHIGSSANLAKAAALNATRLADYYHIHEALETAYKDGHSAYTMGFVLSFSSSFGALCPMGSVFSNCNRL
jgi:hypothetical protein